MNPTSLLRHLRGWLAVAASAALCGCAAVVHTRYQRPVVTMPGHYAHAATTTSTTPTHDTTPWWRNYASPALDHLMQQALAQNNDLAAAAVAVHTARLQAHLAGNSLWPEASADVETGTSKSLRHDKSFSRSSSASFSVGYEVDLWGKLRHYRDKARWEAAATEQDRQSTALSLTGTVADLYWESIYYRQRVALAQQSVTYARKTLDIAQAQYQAGAVTQLDVLEARQSRASQQSSLEDLRQSQVETANALAELFNGHAPQLGKLPSDLPTAAVPAVAPGLPASLLARRPDLRAAEMRLREALANVDYTRASYYPSLSLTGTLGSASQSLKNVLKSPVASLAATLDLPFLDVRDMHDDIAISRSEYAEDVINFRQTLLGALSDVDNALSARQRYARKAHWLQQALQAARNAERIAEAQYQAGAVPLQTWLDNQQTRRSAEASLAQTRLDQLEAYATLSLALGGPLPEQATQSNRAPRT